MGWLYYWPVSVSGFLTFCQSINQSIGDCLCSRATSRLIVCIRNVQIIMHGYDFLKSQVLSCWRKGATRAYSVRRPGWSATGTSGIAYVAYVFLHYVIAYLLMDLAAWNKCGWMGEKAYRSVVSKQIGEKFGRIVLQVNLHASIYGVGFSTRGVHVHDVRPPLAVACSAAASTGWPLASGARVTSLARCVCCSSWSIGHSYV